MAEVSVVAKAVCRVVKGLGPEDVMAVWEEVNNMILGGVVAPSPAPSPARASRKPSLGPWFKRVMGVKADAKNAHGVEGSFVRREVVEGGLMDGEVILEGWREDGAKKYSVMKGREVLVDGVEFAEAKRTMIRAGVPELA